MLYLYSFSCFVFNLLLGKKKSLIVAFITSLAGVVTHGCNFIIEEAEAGEYPGD